MRPQKRKLQSRLSRSGRMRSATVKRASATNADLVRPGVGYRRGVRHVDPTPATDAVLYDETARSLRRAAVEVACLVGIMAVVAAVVAYLARPPAQPLAPASGPFGLSPGIASFLIGIAVVTGLLALILVLRRWHQGRTAAARLRKEERRCTLAAGPLAVQERETADGSREPWLRPEGGEWLHVEDEVFDALEPVLAETTRSPGALDRQTGNDVVREWTAPNTSVLYHQGTGTVIEIRDATGDLVYRHPNYRPGT
jgi:hypothetical protein